MQSEVSDLVADLLIGLLAGGPVDPNSGICENFQGLLPDDVITVAMQVFAATMTQAVARLSESSPVWRRGAALTPFPVPGGWVTHLALRARGDGSLWAGKQGGYRRRLMAEMLIVLGKESCK